MKRLDRDLLRKNIEKAAEYDLINQRVFGSAYCVIQNDEILYKGCFGYTSIDAAEPVMEDTIFRLASMTKPVTAMAILILIERGMVALSDPVEKYLPEFRDVHVIECSDHETFVDRGKAHNVVTIRHLLTHTAGFGSEEKKVVQMTAKDKSTIDDSVRYYLNAGLDFEPGTKQQYSGTGSFDVLVKVIEQVTGTDYQEFLCKEIFEPCCMSDTTFVPTKEQRGRMMAMHNKVDGKSIVRRMGENCVFGDYPCTHYLGGAGLVSTLNDYVNFAMMLFHQGRTGATELISKETFQLLCTPHMTQDVMPGNVSWGLGVRVIVDETYLDLPVKSFGWSGAYGSHFWVDPENRIVAVLMKNSIYYGNLSGESAQNFEKAVAASFIHS